ncbi:MAG TPA: Fic family protein [Rhodoferax sp.]
MASQTRYDATGVQSETEPGSRGRVLRNLLGIKRIGDMNEAESQALLLAQAQAVDLYSDDQRFAAQDICDLHRLWLAPIYVWAGEYRSVNIGKAGFQFAHAPLIQGLMAELERGVLSECTPCRPSTDASAARSLAMVHAELILIHPFRDGNGRVARLLALLMGLQAGLPPLDFSSIDGANKDAYILGIHAAMGRNYDPLIEMFERVISQTWAQHVASNAR